jgi:hypothetical protein
MKRVIAEPGYYELKIRYANKGEKGQYYDGANGIFSRRTNMFNSVENCLAYLISSQFDDSVVFHKDLLEPVLDFNCIEFDTNEVRWSDCKEWFNI